MAKRWMCIFVPLLPCQRLLRLRPVLRRKPFVVIEQVGAKVGVVAASPAALRGGVRIAHTLAAARAILPELPAFEREANKDALALEGIAEWAQGFGPYVALYSDDALVVEVGGSAKLFGGEEGLIRDAQRGANKLGYLAKFSIASTPRAAHALCLGGFSISADAGEKRLLKLPLATLSLASGTIEGFEALGIRDLGGLLALPRTSLVARFDAELIRRLAEFEGSVEELPLRFNQASERIERVEFDEPVEDGRGMLFLLKRLADRLSERLRNLGLGARRLRLSFGLSQERRIEDIGLAEASASAKAWLMLLGARLEAIGELPPIHDLSLEALDTGVIKGAQRQLFAQRAESHSEELVSLLDRISARIGVSNVMRPELSEAFLPEREWQGVEIFAKAKGSLDQAQRLPRRPALLFQEAKSILVESEGGTPLRVGRQAVVASEGPERIVESWLDGGAARDYWQVTLDDGECLWIFRQHADGSFYQHGVFA